MDVPGDAGFDPLPLIDAAVHETNSGDDAPGPIPFSGGWIGTLSYEVGRSIEPRCRVTHARSRPDGHSWPDAALARCDRALVHDARGGRWWSVAPVGAPPLEALLATMARDTRTESICTPASIWRLDDASPTTSRDAWIDAVRRVIEYIRAGDVFQVNLTHLLHGQLRMLPAVAVRGANRSASSRGFALDALARAEAWHGALLELPDGSTILSFSPELFLAGTLGGDRSILSRPIKGTRPAGTRPESLLDSVKDEAELNMIVDLMRNDLGRIALPRSVVVDEPRHIEHHPTVLQAVATVRATLRPGVGIGDVLRATFPPGSVTGAPKIRAMQIIEELEPFARGPYCGAIGCFADAGPFSLSVAIRTLAIAPPREGVSEALYGVGCGVVADSDPDAEWQESIDKAAVLETIREPGADR